MKYWQTKLNETKYIQNFAVGDLRPSSYSLSIVDTHDPFPYSLQIQFQIYLYFLKKKKLFSRSLSTN